MKNMSFALTTAQVLAGTKDVTRRMGWLNLKAGDLFQPVEKGMGLKKGETVHKLCEPVRTLITRREPLATMAEKDRYGWRETRREGFSGMSPDDFIDMFCSTHKGCLPGTIITRIEFSYDLLEGWLPMTSAPRDGTEIELLLRHTSWHYAKGADRDQWQQAVRARWIDFNGGGWTWRGVCGRELAWRPVA